MVKEFARPDATTYWHVFEAREIDLASTRILAIQKRTIQNLTTDDCESVIEAEHIDYNELYGEPDPFG